MIITSTQRVIKAGFVGFFRNAFVSIATMLVMMITMFVVGTLVFMNAALVELLDNLESQVDINAYFTVDATEGQVLAVKNELQALPDVSGVVYVSRDQALKNFKDKRSKGGDNSVTLEGLELLGENPFGASLAIKAEDPTKYAAIAEFLKKKQAQFGEASNIIENVNYHQHKHAIDKLNTIIKGTQQSGAMRTIFLIIVSILIIFNTIRLAVYTNKDEIEVMQLVGASNWFVRGPYVIEGMLYGLVSGLVVLALFYPITIYYPNAVYPSGPITGLVVSDFDPLAFYINNFKTLFLYIVGSGTVLGAVSSYLAVRRYLGV